MSFCYPLLVWSPNLGCKHELLYCLNSPARHEYENLTIVWCWPNSIEIRESPTAALWEPPVWLTGVMPRHNCHHCPLFSPTDVSSDTEIQWRGNNWEFESVSRRFRPHHTQTSAAVTSFLKFHSPHCQGISTPWECQRVFVTFADFVANPETGIWWWQCQE